MKLLKSVVAALSCLIAPAIAYAAPICPVLTGASSAYYTADTAASSNCNTIITVNANGTLSFAYPNTHPYDGSDDNYVGVVNNYGSSIAGLKLTGTADIFGFDGDGIDHFGIASNVKDTSSGGYGGADAYFSAVAASGLSGTVNFLGGIASGGTGYFSLENAPQGGVDIVGTIVSTTPEPSSLILLGTGVLGLAGAVRRRFTK